MPVYTYHCDNCEHEFDKRQSFSDNSLKTCPSCKKKTLRKVYKPARVVFKGSGYYVTDNKSSKKATTTTAEKKDTNGKSETKSEKKTEKKETKSSSRA